MNIVYRKPIHYKLTSSSHILKDIFLLNSKLVHFVIHGDINIVCYYLSG